MLRIETQTIFDNIIVTNQTTFDEFKFIHQ